MRRVSTDRSVVYIAKGATDDEKPLTTAVCDSMKPQLRVFYRPVLRKKKENDGFEISSILSLRLRLQRIIIR
jgi:hypothetical protein